ncbi:MAG TPA: peptidoglycan-binding domain-containing protein [Hyphomicrobiales bacterium]|nr:peptidoglycan-binding domain-containing protein [Hyphomicrobiales bacterium]
MKSIALALVAATALSLPALAQTSPTANEQTQTPSSQVQTSPSGGMQSNKSEISTPISPESLSKQQIKQVQQALNQNGFQNVKPDGVWGPDTADALKQFQQKQNIQANGELDQQTLSALNVQVSSSMQQGRAATGMPPEQNNASGGMDENNGAKSITGSGMKPGSGTSAH